MKARDVGKGIKHEWRKLDVLVQSICEPGASAESEHGRVSMDARAHERDRSAAQKAGACVSELTGGWVQYSADVHTVD